MTHPRARGGEAEGERGLMWGRADPLPGTVSADWGLSVPAVCFPVALPLVQQLGCGVPVGCQEGTLSGVHRVHTRHPPASQPSLSGAFQQMKMAPLDQLPPPAGFVKT